MMRSGLAAILLTGTLLTTPALGFSESGQYVVHGSGNASCREWISDRERDDAGAWQLEQWLLGYLTAYNERVSGFADIAENMEGAVTFEWFDSWCAGEPTESLAGAASAFVAERHDALEGR